MRGSLGAVASVRSCAPVEIQEFFGGSLGAKERMFRIGESLPSGMNGGDEVTGLRVKKVLFCLFLPPERAKRVLYKEEFSV